MSFNFRLLRASLGDTEMVLCGVARYWRRKMYMACFQLGTSLVAARIDF